MTTCPLVIGGNASGHSEKACNPLLKRLVGFVSVTQYCNSEVRNGRGSRVVKVTDSGLPCHEFEPSTTKDPPCRAAMHVKSVES
ncbi:hypothetical protein TNCV_2155491 [Trichonephila clavipes]|nr:hypothetical protein TNCV_2155491 [Trichonephila clavipes]